MLEPRLDLSVTIPESMAGARLDDAVASLADVSRDTARSLIRLRGVRVSRTRTPDAGTVLAAGDRIRIRWRGEGPAEAPAVRVVHRDEHLAVVVKPAGIPVTPARLGSGPCLLDVLSEQISKDRGGAFHATAVHRLDLPVSGVMVVANGARAAARLTERFQAHDVAKVYVALVMRTPAGAAFLDRCRGQAVAVDAPLAWIGGSQKAVPGPGGKPSLSVVRWVADVGADLALVALRLVTGRTHQARCHLAGVGVPVWRDRKYGAGVGHVPRGRTLVEGRDEAERIALHAAYLRFPHPWSSGVVEHLELPEADFWSGIARACDRGLADAVHEVAGER
jgi:23S rRNA pseudouridine1911/1915/1917 synthase